MGGKKVKWYFIEATGNSERQFGHKLIFYAANAYCSNSNFPKSKYSRGALRVGPTYSPHPGLSTHRAFVPHQERAPMEGPSLPSQTHLTRVFPIPYLVLGAGV